MLRVLGLAVVFSEAVTALDFSQCRCTSYNCLAEVPFHTLNASVNGRLVHVPDEMKPCFIDGIQSFECAVDLNKTDDEFFYTSQVGGFMHSGLYPSGRRSEPGWTLAHNLSVFAVAAENSDDVQAAVAFAGQWNLRLVVKSTGHDWFGRSGSHPDLKGSLMVWTHKLKNITWHEEPFIPEGCINADAVADAVTVGAGVQFADLYPKAEDRNRIVNGGTCTSVGIAGCTLGGCFGSFSQALGSAASNLVQAHVILANGSRVTASTCENSDLFWAMRGGGAGFGVITDLTYRSYPTPEYITYVDFEGSIQNPSADDVQAAAVEVLRAADQAVQAHQGWNGGLRIPTLKAPSYGLTLSTYNGNARAGEALLGDVLAWTKAQGLRFSGSINSRVEHRPASGWAVPGAPEGQVTLPWDDPHHDSEIGTEHLVSMSKWITHSALSEGPGDIGFQKVATALINLTTISTSGLLASLPTTVSLDMAKSQGGASPLAVDLFRKTAQSPVLLDTVAFLTSQWRVPTLPQLPPSSEVLKALWPRLQKYAITSPSDPLYSVCEIGAKGNSTSALACFDGWSTRVPSIVNELMVLKDELWRQFPPTRDNISHWSGSYWNEADFYEPDWQISFWGAATYAKLLAVKHSYDPTGLLTCHHCVGSEEWDPTGNCKRGQDTL